MDRPEYHLLSKYYKGEATEEEVAVVDEWINDSPENKEEAKRLQEVWKGHGEYADNYQPDMMVAWESIGSKMEEDDNMSSSSGINRYYRIAAMLVIGSGLVAYFWINSGRMTGLKQENTIISANNSNETAALPDGSIITLREGTTVAYGPGFGTRDRHVELEGEAFFEIAEDDRNPFTIRSGKVNIEVLGTSFLVGADDNFTTVAVVTGKVSFQGDRSEPVVLTKGNKGIFSKADGTVNVLPNDDANFLSWKTGELVFSNTSLEVITKDLERHYRVSVSLDSALVTRGLILTATFEDQSLEEVFEVLTSTLDLTVEKESQNKYLLK